MHGLILHDYFATREGGGRLALTLGDRLDLPVVAGSVYRGLDLDHEWPGLSISALGPHVSNPLIRIPLQVRRWRRYTARSGFVIYSGHYCPLSAPGTTARRIYYCHTPPRFVYDQRDFWLEHLPRAMRPLAKQFLAWYQPAYEGAVAAMDILIANSRNVRQRIETYLGRDSIVVHPPCDTGLYEWQADEGYYLSNARLDPLKRVDRIVAAFLRMPEKRLIVTSDGAERDRLQRLAGGAANISFTGAVADRRMRELLARCIASIYIPADEDFGMSPVESMASGKPVIGAAEGGLLETVVPDITGILVEDAGDVDQLVAAVRNMTPARASSMRASCRDRARAFDTGVFIESMTRHGELE